MSKVLPLVAIALVGLLVMGRLGREPTGSPPAATAQVTEAPEARSSPPPRRTAPGGGADASVRPATPELDRLVVLASRQRLSREERYTYIDSLLLTSDSVVRRWADRNGRPLRIALVDSPELSGWRAALPTIARRAFAAWQEVYPELRFEVVPDPDAAEVTVSWIEKFEIDRTGQTDLAYLPTGTIEGAHIQLALQARSGQPLHDTGLAAVAVHEVGHALGLPHSANPRDVMFPDTRGSTISARDRATLVLLYAVPPGSIRLDR